MSIIGKKTVESLKAFAECEHKHWKCDKCGCRTELAMLQRDAQILRAAIEDGGFDLSPCMDCGTPVVCIPDGLAMCKDCATKNV